MVGGLGVSTLLTLAVVPSAYLILHGIVDRLKGMVLARKGETASGGKDVPEMKETPVTAS